MRERPGVGLLLSRLRARERQQSAIAILGQIALSGLDVAELGQETLGLVAQALKAPHVRLLLPDGTGALRPLAGLGCPEGAQGEARAAFCSGLAIGGCHPIPGEGEPLGVLEVSGRELIADEHVFLSSVCGILSQAIRRIRREQALQTSEALLQSTFDTLGDGIAVLDVDGTIREVNASWRRLVPQTCLGVDYRGILQDVSPRVRRDADEVIAGVRDAMQAEILLGSRWVDLRMKRFSCGPVTRILATHSDITERRQAEKALQESEEQLRHAMKMEAVGRLAGGIAHDFNNLLTAILGYANLLNSADEGLHEIRRAAESARELTRQLLGFSRKGVSRLESVELHEVVEGLGELLRRIMGEDVDLQIDLAPGDTWLEADRGQIEQILMNLAANARDAMPAGGSLSIRTRRRILPAGPHVELEVRDTGVGMDEETCARIFEPYFTTKGPGQGSGLGLSIVYGILQRHGGQVTVESEPGQGTCFRIVLPQGKRNARRSRSSADGDVEGGHETILLVEDEGSIRRLTRRILEDRGYRVLEACDGAEALDRIGSEGLPVDLVLTDVVMPRMTGPELVRRLQERFPQVRVLYISGYAESTILREGLAGSGAVLLEKPFTPLDLARRVREQLDAAWVVVA